MTSTARFDDLIHAPVRLRLCGLLRPVDALSFQVLAETLDLTSVNLSKNLKALAAAGYVSIDKRASTERTDARRVAWVKLTAEGRNAFDAHVAKLKEITQA